MALKAKKAQPKKGLTIEGERVKTPLARHESPEEARGILRRLVDKVTMLNETFRCLKFEPILDKAVYFSQKTCFAGICALSNTQLMKNLGKLRMHVSAAKTVISRAKQHEYSPFFNEGVRRIPKVLLKLLISYLNEQDTYDYAYAKMHEKDRTSLRRIRVKIP